MFILKKIRRNIGLILLDVHNDMRNSPITCRRVRLLMGRPDGVLFPEYGNRTWFYWMEHVDEKNRYGVSVGFDDNNEMTRWDMVFGVKESQLGKYESR